MPEAIIFVPPEPAARPWLTICAAYCARCGYHIVAVVSAWDDVWRLLKDDTITVEVVVIGRKEHLPPDGTPRIEVVTDPPPDDPPDTRRPRRT